MPVAGASGAADVRAAVSHPPIGPLVNTLVVRNSNGLRTILNGSSYYDTNYPADDLVLHRSGLTLMANKLWDGPGAASRALNDVQHRSSSEVVVLAADQRPQATFLATGRRCSMRLVRPRSVI